LIYIVSTFSVCFLRLNSLVSCGDVWLHDKCCEDYCLCLQADSGDGADDDDECIDLDKWDSRGNDENDVTNDHQLTQYSAVSQCQYYVSFSRIKYRALIA